MQGHVVNKVSDTSLLETVGGPASRPHPELEGASACSAIAQLSQSPCSTSRRGKVNKSKESPRPVKRELIYTTITVSDPDTQGVHVLTTGSESPAADRYSTSPPPVNGQLHLGTHRRSKTSLFDVSSFLYSTAKDITIVIFARTVVL